jgi:hypothetical protein
MELLFTFKGKLSLTDAGGLAKMIADLGLPTSPTDDFNLPLDFDGVTYYANSEVQRLWLAGQGKQLVFIVGTRPTPKQFATEAGDIMAWEKQVKDRLTEAGTNIDAELELITQENLTRELTGKPFMDTSVIEQMYEEASSDLVKTLEPSDFKVGQDYEMKGKMRKFGISKVTAVKPGGVEFTSISTGEVFTIDADQLANNISKQITDMAEAISEQITEVSPEQEEANATSKATNEEITSQEIEQKYEENKDKSVEDVQDNFFKKAKDDEDSCKT